MKNDKMYRLISMPKCSYRILIFAKSVEETCNVKSAQNNRFVNFFGQKCAEKCRKALCPTTTTNTFSTTTFTRFY